MNKKELIEKIIGKQKQRIRLEKVMIFKKMDLMKFTIKQLNEIEEAINEDSWITQENYEQFREEFR